MNSGTFPVTCMHHVPRYRYHHHRHHMLFELLKNSLRAVVETSGEDAEDFPPIKVIVAEGKEVCTR
jgi:hypothetical protein